jgi:hypothetical protein
VTFSAAALDPEFTDGAEERLFDIPEVAPNV